MQKHINLNDYSAGLTRDLFTAAAHGDRAQVNKLLWQDKVDPNAANEAGTTALHIAAKYGQRIVVNELITKYKVNKEARCSLRLYCPALCYYRRAYRHFS